MDTNFKKIITVTGLAMAIFFIQSIYYSVIIQRPYYQLKPLGLRYGKLVKTRNTTTYICSPNYPTMLERTHFWTKELFEAKLNEAINGENINITRASCSNCFLNASCYTLQDQFYPSLCDLQLKFKSLSSCLAKDPPLLLIGDSRIRGLTHVIHNMITSIENVTKWKYNSVNRYEIVPWY